MWNKFDLGCHPVPDFFIPGVFFDKFAPSTLRELQPHDSGSFTIANINNVVSDSHFDALAAVGAGASGLAPDQVFHDWAAPG